MRDEINVIVKTAESGTGWHWVEEALTNIKEYLTKPTDDLAGTFDSNDLKLLTGTIEKFPHTEDELRSQVEEIIKLLEELLKK